MRRSRLRRLRSGLSNLSLARRFLLVSLALVVVGGAAVAWVLGQLIETSAINRTTSVTALYVESFVAPELQSLANTSSLTQPEIDSLQNLLSPNSPVGHADRGLPDLVDQRHDPVQPEPPTHGPQLRDGRRPRSRGAGGRHR